MKVPQTRAAALMAADHEAQRAGAFWDAYDRAVHAMRFWLVRLSLRKKRLENEYERPGGPRPAAVDYLQKQVEEAYDMFLAAKDRISTCAETARGHEMMAKIYWEEADEKHQELQFLPEPSRWQHGKK